MALSKHTLIWELVVWRAVSSPIKYSCPPRDWFPDLWQIPKFRRFSRPLYKMTFVYRLQQVYLHITLFLWQIQILLFGTFWDSPLPPWPRVFSIQFIESMDAESENTQGCVFWFLFCQSLKVTKTKLIKVQDFRNPWVYLYCCSLLAFSFPAFRACALFSHVTSKETVMKCYF